MILAQRIRLNPTADEESYFRRAAGTARFAWNWALNRYKAIKQAGGKANWNDIKKDFRQAIDREFPWVREVTKCAPEQAIADLRQSICTYYKAKPKGQKVKFPGYRKRSKKIGGFGLANDKFSVSGNTATIPKLGPVNMAEALRFAGKIMSGRVSEKAGHWYLTVAVEVDAQRVPSLSGSVGIDFGLLRFATLSNGEVCETQACFRRSERKLAALQRGLTRKKKGSHNRTQWKLRVARLHERIRNQRQDFIHKFTSTLATLFAVICVEDLDLKALAKTRLSKSFADAGVGEAVRQLEYKSGLRSSLVQKVGRWFASSKLCSACGWKNGDLMLADRMWTCANCGCVHDRDMNAARNIELEGLRLLAGNGYLGVTPVDSSAPLSVSAGSVATG